MFEFLLWIVILFIVWKVTRVSVSVRRHSRETHATKAPFSNIEEAEFEDLSRKQPPSPTTPDGTQQPQ